MSRASTRTSSRDLTAPARVSRSASGAACQRTLARRVATSRVVMASGCRPLGPASVAPPAPPDAPVMTPPAPPAPPLAAAP